MLKSLSWISLCLIATSLWAEPSHKEMESYVGRAVAKWQVPGLVISVVREARVVYQDAFGLRLQNVGVPLNEETLFPIGSLSKAFTAALLALLVDRGELSFNTRVQDIVPDQRLLDPFVSKSHTLSDLLAHRMGFSSHAGDLLYLQHDHERIWPFIRYIPLVESFRRGFAYQNLSFLILGRALSAISGKSWDALVQSELLEPLGMKRSSTGVRRLAYAKNCAMPHLPLDGSVYIVPWQKQVEFGPAGSVVSCAKDMSLWMRFLLGTIPGPKHSYLALRPLFRPQVYLDKAPWIEYLYPKHGDLSYGMGWFLYNHRGRPVVEHAGNLPGISCKMALMPKEGIGVFVACNQHLSLLPHALIMWIFDRFLGEVGRNWADELFPLSKQYEKKLPVLTNFSSMALETKKPFLGTYRHKVYGNAKIVDTGSHLSIQLGKRLYGELADMGAGRYFVRWRGLVPRFFPANGFLQFSRDVRGEPRSFRLQGVGSFYKRSFSRSLYQRSNDSSGAKST